MGQSSLGETGDRGRCSPLGPGGSLSSSTGGLDTSSWVSASVTGGSRGGGGTRVAGSLRGLELVELPLRPFGGVSMAMLDSENGTTPARRAISCSPSCQCMASAARHGIDISSAIFDHISALNLSFPSDP